MMSSPLRSFIIILGMSLACTSPSVAQAPPAPLEQAPAQVRLGPWQLTRGQRIGPGLWRDVRLEANAFTLMAQRLRVEDANLILEGQVRLIGDPTWRLLAPKATASLDTHQVTFIADPKAAARLAQQLPLKVTVRAQSILFVFEPKSPAKLTLESPFAPVPQRS